MCGGGNTTEYIQAKPMSTPEADTYKGPPGPGTNIAGVPIPGGGENYQRAAQSLLSTGQSYGQLASGLASMLGSRPPMAPPPAPQSAFSGGVGQYLGSLGAQPTAMSPAMAGVGAMESFYDPRTSAIGTLGAYEPAFEAQPLTYYTPNSMERLQGAQQAAAAPTPAAPAPAQRTNMTMQDIIDQRRNKTPYQRMQDLRRRQALGQTGASS